MAKSILLEKLRELAFPVERTGAEGDRSRYERLAIPHSFKPQLSVGEAVISAGGALLRIFCGSLLFAVWGTYTLVSWQAIRNVFMRALVLAALILLFVVAFALLMLAISTLVRMVWPRRAEHP